MCTRACIEFARANLSAAEIQGRSVIEVGSLDVNGSVRAIVEALKPASYIGVDMQAGPGVDQVCDAGALVDRFGNDAFDWLISTELLEHVRDWRRVVSNFKRVLKPGGGLLITTRSRGFAYHAYPHDFWRYELADMRAIFSDFEIETLTPDPGSPGVLFKARKPIAFVESDMSGYQLFSIITERLECDVSDVSIEAFHRRGRRQRIVRAPERLFRRIRKHLLG